MQLSPQSVLKHFITSKRCLVPLTVTPHFPPHLPSPRQPLIYVLPLWIEFAYSGHFLSVIIQSVVTDDQLLSLDVMFSRSEMLWHVSVLHSFLWLNCILLYGYATFYLSNHQLINMWVVCSFWLLRSFCIDICFHFSCVYIWVIEEPGGL